MRGVALDGELARRPLLAPLAAADGGSAGCARSPGARCGSSWWRGRLRPTARAGAGSGPGRAARRRTGRPGSTCRRRGTPSAGAGGRPPPSARPATRAMRRCTSGVSRPCCRFQAITKWLKGQAGQRARGGGAAGAGDGRRRGPAAGLPPSAAQSSRLRPDRDEPANRLPSDDRAAGEVEQAARRRPSKLLPDVVDAQAGSRGGALRRAGGSPRPGPAGWRRPSRRWSRRRHRRRARAPRPGGGAAPAPAGGGPRRRAGGSPGSAGRAPGAAPCSSGLLRLLAQARG